MNKFPFEVVGSSRRCLVVNVPGHGRCFISTKNVALLCEDPHRAWAVVEKPSNTDRFGRMFSETKWVAVAHMLIF
jgi:hypothetical protein